MGRPKGFVPAACPECANRGRHKTTCSRVGGRQKPIETQTRSNEPVPHIRPYKPREETESEKEAVVEGGLAAIHAYVSYKQNYKCDGTTDGQKCGTVLEMGRQHWTDGNGKHLCMEHAGAYERKRSAA